MRISVLFFIQFFSVQSFSLQNFRNYDEYYYDADQPAVYPALTWAKRNLAGTPIRSSSWIKMSLKPLLFLIFSLWKNMYKRNDQKTRQ